MRIHLLVSFVILFGVACGDDPEPSTGSISGTVTAEGAGPLEGVVVTIGDLSGTTDAAGIYSIGEVPVGSATVVYELDDPEWEDAEVETAVGQGEPKTIDVELAIGMQVLAADKSLADTYNTTFDWSADAVSVIYVPKPTRGALERGMFWHNPALYADPAGEPQITPATLPAVGTAASFDFPVPTGPDTGTQAIEQGTIVNAIGDTPLSAIERANGVMWEPAVEDFLLEWNLDATTPLFLAGLAVTSQEWTGAPSLAPQEIEMLYVHEGDLWVKVVFQGFVDVDASVTDTDGDGLPEVFGKITSSFVGTDVYDQLEGEYIMQEHGSLELRDLLDIVVDGLYSRSNPAVVSSIGVPYESTEVGGTFAWPFAVVGHGEPGTPSYVVNIFLVEPAE